MPGGLQPLVVPLQPYHAQSEDDAGNNDTVEGSRVGRGSQYLSGHDILDLWAAGRPTMVKEAQPANSAAREQPLGDVALLEQNQGDRVQGEHHHGKADAAIGEDGEVITTISRARLLPTRSTILQAMDLAAPLLPISAPNSVPMKNIRK